MTDDALSLLTRYRPQDFDAVRGNRRVVHAFATSLGEVPAYLLSGPSGIGKTTLARIASNKLRADMMEIDGATFTGVDSIREIQERVSFHSLLNDRRAVIIDEAHRLSKQAWDATLKILEEPPPWLTWFLCTTAPDKLPATVRSRCHHVKLQELSIVELERLVEDIAEREGIQLIEGVSQVCAATANGSARQALANLSEVRHVRGLREVNAMLRGSSAADGIPALCKLLMNGGTWLQATTLVTNISRESDAEACRLAITAYLAAVLIKVRNGSEAVYLMNILEQFAEPYHPGERMAPLLLSVGRCLFGDMGGVEDDGRTNDLAATYP